MLHPEYHTCDKCGKIIKRTLDNGIVNSYTLSINVPNGSSLLDIERIGEEYVQNNELGDVASDVRVRYENGFVKVQFDKEIIMEQRLMAVWRYDMPPYYNGGEIDRFTIDGRVVPKGYGNSCFEPIKIAPLDELKIRELKKMREDYSEDVAELCSAYKYKAELLFGIHSTEDKSSI